MLCIKHNEDGRFARSTVGLRGKTLKKPTKGHFRSPDGQTSNIEHRTLNIESKMEKHLSPALSPRLRRAERETIVWHVKVFSVQFQVFSTETRRRFASARMEDGEERAEGRRIKHRREFPMTKDK
jgi:hypothetical protein